MLLNRTFYQELWDKYQNTETLMANLNENISVLTIKIILDQNKNEKPIYFNFQVKVKTFEQIAQQLFVELANNIYCDSADFPPLKKGDFFKR